MIYLELFLTFLEIGAVSFGGGYGMISLIREKCISSGWLTESALMNFIAVSESTPGPIAVNMATFVGSSQAGLGGALLATLGVVLPAFLVILIVAMAVRQLLRYAGVRAALGGVRPVIVGLIFATGITMLISVTLGMSAVGERIEFDYRPIVVIAAVALVAVVWKKLRKSSISPILLILLSAGLGMLLYSF